ncbi:MAG: polyprenyl synthetase family protein [Clostridiales bacterium]|nr:polyprenyl synthetase family protein [Clostridiales bacterium]
MTFQEEFALCQREIETSLENYFTENLPQGRLLEAMRYSLLAGGKRIRPVLTLKFCEIAGGDPKKALPIACAVEMLHTYSLIHDDMPCMDNDSLRRGRPTNHVVYGECTATLAGDALQSAAFEAILSADLPSEVRAAAALELARAAGCSGMCGGQQLDIEGEERGLSLEEIARMNGLKTGCLLRAACVMGVLAAGVPADSAEARAAASYADAIGLAFQIRDDMLNVTSDAATMGKPVGNDAESHKSTYVSHLGLEQCQAVVDEQTAKAKRALCGVFAETAFLENLAEYLAGRAN